LHDHPDAVEAERHLAVRRPGQRNDSPGRLGLGQHATALVGMLRERGKAGDWTRARLVPCTGEGYLYCFQQ